MTDLDKRIDEIMELDKARTQGIWTACLGKFNGWVTHFSITGEKHGSTKPIAISGDGITGVNEKRLCNNIAADAKLIAKAPEMVSIIAELRAELAARDKLLRYGTLDELAKESERLGFYDKSEAL